MFHACLFAKDPIYRERAMQTCKEDRPFIVQLCANDPDQLVEAGLLVQNHCDAVDINLGCPQAIARKGRNAAFLHDDWDLISKMCINGLICLSLSLLFCLTVCIIVFLTPPKNFGMFIWALLSSLF